MTDGAAAAAGDPRAAWSVTAGSDETGFGRLIDALRRVQDAVTAAAPPSEVVAHAAGSLDAVATALAAYAVDEHRQVSGHLADLPGRGQALTPPVVIDHEDEQSVTGRVTCSRFHLGGGGAAHGGVPPLIWDEVLGRLANNGGRARCRTAYLHVDYRAITPIGVELRLEASVDRVEGRKRFLSGRMHDGETLVSEATGLFVDLRAAQA